MRRPILLAACFVFSVIHPFAAQPLQIRLNSYSIWLSPAQIRAEFGYTWRNAASSQGPEAPANGELMMIDPAQPHLRGGTLFFSTPNGNYVYGFTMNLPTTDANSNGLLDIMEFSQPLETTTSGMYVRPDNSLGTFTTLWIKSPDTYEGNCYFRYDVMDRDFAHSFQSFEYTGSWTPARQDGRTSGSVTLARRGLEALTLIGPLAVDVSAGGAARVADGVWRDENELNWEFSALRDGAFTRGRFEQDLFVVDGLPVLGPADFHDWKLMITDPNDTDNDGLPDLVDPTPTGGGGTPLEPRLEIQLAPNALRITIHGEAGRTYILESAGSIPPATWANPTTVSTTAADTTVDLARPAGATFWRARLQD